MNCMWEGSLIVHVCHPRFLNSRSTDMPDWKILCWGAFPVPCRIWPLPARCQQYAPPRSRDNLKCLQTFPNGPCGAKSPPFENHCSKRKCLLILSLWIWINPISQQAKQTVKCVYPLSEGILYFHSVVNYHSIDTFKDKIYLYHRENWQSPL